MNCSQLRCAHVSAAGVVFAVAGHAESWLSFSVTFSSMQMNGKRSCKVMLLADWNKDAEEEHQLTERKLANMLKAMGLKPGTMTPRQVCPTGLDALDQPSAGLP